MQCFGTIPVFMPMPTPAMTILIVMLVCVATVDQVTINRDNRIFLDERQIVGAKSLDGFECFGGRLSSESPARKVNTHLVQGRFQLT